MNKKVFVLAVFFVLFCLLIYPPLARGLEEAGVIEAQSAGIDVEKPEKDDGILAGIVNPFGDAKYEIQSTYRNYMPLYMQTVMSFQDFTRTINSPIYELYDRKPPVVDPPGDDPDDTDPSVTPGEPFTHKAELLAAKGGKRYYRITLDYGDREVSFLETICDLSDAEKEKRVKQQTEYVNRLVRADKNVNVCVYVASNMEFMDFLPEYLPGEKSDAKYVTEFLDGIDASALKGSIKFSDVEDRVKRCYLTDHHWSAYGQYCGYTDIIGLFRSRCTDILPARPLGKEVTIEPCVFYGSSARTLAYNKISDPFVVYDYGLPYHTSNPEYDFKARCEYLASCNVRDFTTNAYELFSPEIYKVTYPENRTGRKLLVIGDSYTQSMIGLLASSFDEATVFYWRNYQTLDYNGYIEENGITDVLIMLFGERMIFNATNDYFLDRIKVRG